MPVFQKRTDVRRPVGAVFDFISRPGNLVKLAPPDARLLVVEGPDQFHLGAQITWRITRMGLPQHMTQEVTEFHPMRRITMTQVRGPLGKWIHSQEFDESGEGTILHEAIEFEPPRGLLGLAVTAATIHSELQASFAYRARKLKELLAADIMWPE